MTPRMLYAADPARGWMPWGLLTPLLGFVFVVVPVVAASIVLSLMQWTDDQGQPNGFAGLFGLLLLPFPLVALLVWAWVRRVERRPMATLGLRCAARVRSFVRGHAIGMACVLGVVLCIWAAGGYRVGAAGAASASSVSLAGIVLLLPAFALQSSVEEFVFRGWMLSAIARKFNVPVAVLLSSIVFTSLHYNPGQPPLSMVGTMMFALFACGWVLNQGHIWGVMGWHAGWNWLLASGFELPLSGVSSIVPALLVQLVPQGSEALTGGSHGPEASMVSVVVFGAAAAVLLWRSRSAVPQAVSAADPST